MMICNGLFWQEFDSQLAKYPLELYEILFGHSFSSQEAKRTIYYLRNQRELAIQYLVALKNYYTLVRYLHSPVTKRNGECVRLAFWSLLSDLSRILEKVVKRKLCGARSNKSLNSAFLQYTTTRAPQVKANFRTDSGSFKSLKEVCNFHSAKQPGNPSKRLGPPNNSTENQMAVYNKNWFSLNRYIKRAPYSDLTREDERKIKNLGTACYMAGQLRNQVQHGIREKFVVYDSISEGRKAVEVMISLCNFSGWLRAL